MFKHVDNIYVDDIIRGRKYEEAKGTIEINYFLADFTLYTKPFRSKILISKSVRCKDQGGFKTRFNNF